VTNRTRVILIGGTSHVGKSTFARSLADDLGWQCMSTDMLARHPGRPWRDQGEIPDDVAAYYLSRTWEVLLDEVLHHYRSNVWPIAQAMVRARVSNRFDSCLVLEGSAIWPDCVSDARFERVSSVWLTADAQLISRRIRDESRYSEKSSARQKMIDAFLNRSLAFNERVMESVERSNQRRIDVGVSGALNRLSREFVDLIDGEAG
jgi:2-phosphoglycerate kinase